MALQQESYVSPSAEITAAQQYPYNERSALITVHAMRGLLHWSHMTKVQHEKADLVQLVV